MDISDDYQTDLGQNSVLAPVDAFFRVLRSALNHLYDPDSLRQSSLAAIFGVSNRFDTPSALQNILIKAIESLKPRAGEPNRDYAQTIYNLLLCRYVQQVNQKEIASQLGISIRHFRRQQNLAVYELACKLWKQYDLGNQERLVDEYLAETGVSSTANSREDDSSELIQELDWLKGTMLQIQTDLSWAIPNALDLIQPLLEQNRTVIHIPTKIAGLLVVHPVVFQEVLLSVLSFTAQMCGENEGRLELIPRLEQQEIRITGNRAEQTALDKEKQKTLETLHQLVKLSQGTLNFKLQGPVFQARIIFPSIEPVTVLVIDDNPEIITIMQRFTVETLYRVIGISDPRSAIEQALKVQPKLIVMDILMPQIDGLQVLSRFKHHPELGHIPIIVCSVLNQKDLAASLGASGFISKPIRRASFIAVLNAVHGHASR